MSSAGLEMPANPQSFFTYPSQKQERVPVAGDAKNLKTSSPRARTMCKDKITVESLFKKKDLFVSTKIPPTKLQKRQCFAKTLAMKLLGTRRNCMGHDFAVEKRC